MTYFYSKLIGSGFAFTIFMGFIFLFIDNSLFELSETLSSPWIWAAFYGYAIFCSVIIDGVLKRWPVLRRWTLLLYIFAGYIVFAFIMFHWIYMIIAGSVGAIVAVLYFIGNYKIARYKWLGAVFAIIPLIFVWMTFTDFTQKENWEEQRQDNSFIAQFSYFDGEHHIPIQLEDDDTLSFEINFEASGGYGFHFENNKGDYLPLEEKGNQLVFHASEAGEYEIVVRGREAKGTFTVDWIINE